MSKTSWKTKQQRLRNLLVSVSSVNDNEEASDADNIIFSDDEHFQERSYQNLASEQ